MGSRVFRSDECILFTIDLGDYGLQGGLCWFCINFEIFPCSEDGEPGDIGDEGTIGTKGVPGFIFVLKIS